MADVISSKSVKIRKPRKCWTCADLYEVGTSLNRVVSKDGGEIMAAYFCKCCQAYILKMDYDDSQDGFGSGDFRSEQDYQEFKKQYTEKQLLNQ